MSTNPIKLPSSSAHELKCRLASWTNIVAGARATCRRIDDRDFRAGDRLAFLLVMADGRLVEPRQQFDAVVTRVELLAGPHLLYGLPLDGCDETYPQLVPGKVSHGPGCPYRDGEPDPLPFALIHFHALEDEAPRLVGDVEDYRKILSFAASAGDTITVPEALDVIKSICRNHLFSVRGQS